MVAYVTPAEMNGGILQFSTTIARETVGLTDFRLFLPNVIGNEYIRDIQDNVIYYSKKKTLKSTDSGVIALADQIASTIPNVVIFLEDTILMQQVNAILHNRGIKTVLVVHDIEHHPYRNMSLRRMLVDGIRRLMTIRTVKNVDNVILLSNNSEAKFRERYKVTNTLVFRLSAHVPMVESSKPPEMSEEENYYLFFGRLDEYKGIEILCQAYSKLSHDRKIKNKLIIAGRGVLSETEKQLIAQEDCIQLIQRFISDYEMIWLFEHCQAVVLPYIEASQSGVLPIAYKFGRPVIVSKLDGLTENVLPGVTGLVFNNESELTKCLEKIDSLFKSSGRNIKLYYEEQYDWKRNIGRLLFELNAMKQKRERH